MNDDMDGVNHINIYSKAETDLGRFLSNFSSHKVITNDGEFASIEGYWYWLNAQGSNRREELRKVVGWEAKKVGRELRAASWGKDELFKVKIAHAMLSKLILHPEIFKLFKESTLPFRHYYVYSGKIVEPKEGKWIVDFWEYLRKMVGGE